MFLILNIFYLLLEYIIKLAAGVLDDDFWQTRYANPMPLPPPPT